LVITDFLKIDFCHNQFEKTQFGQVILLQVTNVEGEEELEAESPQRVAIV